MNARSFCVVPRYHRPVFGSHLSIAGDMTNALREAEGLGLDTVQVFTKNQRQWKVAPLKDEARSAWLAELARLGWSDRAVAHNSYLVNLASPDEGAWERSVETQREEIERCEALSIPLLVSHPGSHLGTGEEAGIARIGFAYARLFKETPGYRTVVCIENTVGGGSNLGGPFEHLAAIRGAVIRSAEDLGVDPDEAAGRVAFCFDTCHAHGAGHDMTSEEAAAATLDRFDAVCGPGLLRVMHVNDSKAPRASKRDLHEHIGRGTIGLGAFAAVVKRPALANVPKILETPKGEAPADLGGGPWDAINLSILRALQRGETPSVEPAQTVKPARTASRASSKKPGAGSSKEKPGAPATAGAKKSGSAPAGGPGGAGAKTARPAKGVSKKASKAPRRRP